MRAGVLIGNVLRGSSERTLERSKLNLTGRSNRRRFADKFGVATGFDVADD
jgi:hypothetical protein